MTAWYATSRSALHARFGSDASLMAALLAATSPRQTMRANVTMALRTYHLYQQGAELGLRLLPAHRVNVVRALRGEPLSGLKVSALHQNLLGDESAVAVDRWVVRFYRGRGMDIEYRGIEESLYHQIESEVCQDAKIMGVTPAQMQVSVWCFMNGERLTYADYLSQLDMFDSKV
jgi:hypothetical protein